MNEQYGQPVFGGRNFNPEAWAEKKQEEREKVYDMIEQMISETTSDPEAFMGYLDTQARLDRYSVANTLLILKQYPTATQLKEKRQWTEERAYVRQNERAIKILEPAEYIRRDGEVGTAYNVKWVYDISQTSIRERTEPEQNDLKQMTMAMVNSSPVPVLMNNERTTPEQKAVYDHDMKKLFVRQGMANGTELFQWLAGEMAFAQLAMEKKTYDREECRFEAGCIAYLLCRKNGVDAGKYAVSALPNAWKGMETKDLRAEMTRIKTAFGEVQGRMTDELYRMRREQERSQERERRQQERMEKQGERGREDGR